jgi:hypothetical protein
MGFMDLGFIIGGKGYNLMLMNWIHPPEEPLKGDKLLMRHRDKKI